MAEESGPRTTPTGVKDVRAQDFITAFAAYLKQTNKARARQRLEPGAAWWRP